LEGFRLGFRRGMEAPRRGVGPSEGVPAGFWPSMEAAPEGGGPAGKGRAGFLAGYVT